MNTIPVKHRSMGITLRTALLSWLVTSVTLLIFVVVIIPQQKRTFQENLESKAQGVAVSLRDIAAGSAVNEDFSSVVDHCKEILQGDKVLDYLVITKNDGFSLISDRSGWRNETNYSKEWRPDKRVPSSGLGVVPLFNRRVFHYSQPFDYSGIQWGWIHVGLSLESYDRSVSQVYRRTGILAVGCILLSLFASVIYAKMLVRPILSLRGVVQRVAGGDLAARAVIHSSEELETLAQSFNSMTETLLRRDRVLQSVRFAAQRFLSSPDWNTVIDHVLAKIGQAAMVSRVYVYQNRVDEGGEWMSTRRHEWTAPGVSPQLTNPSLQDMSWKELGLNRWVETLKKGGIIATSVRELAQAEQDHFDQQGIKSLILMPILVEDCWWGFLGLDECFSERQWTDADRDSIRAAADMLGAAIVRQQTQDALVKAKDAAEAASEAKSQFLANMSHEIRTPMTGVMGILQLLGRTELSQKQERYVNNAVLSAKALLSVIGDVLDFSKIEAGRLELEEADLSIRELIDSTVRLFVGKAEEKGLEMAFLVEQAVPMLLRGDANRLQQVLVNLLGNALKFTTQGEIVTRCRVKDLADRVLTLTFEVSDSGCGIAPDHQTMIFEAFSQADNSMRRSFGGTGLGLAISRQLCILMGGTIGVRSEPGKGSTFFFDVKLKSPLGKPEAASGLRDLRSLQILVVDDCAVIRELVKESVLSWKGEVAEAADAISALQQLRAAVKRGRPIDVALLDWKMPGIDGLALARLIKGETELKSTRLVLLSSFVQTVGEGVGYPELSGFVPKPVSGSDLYDAIVMAANGQLKALSPPSSKESKMELEVPQGDGTHAILLAEDNEINQEMAKEMIQQLGYRCQCAITGLQVVELVKSNPPDLILMDCQMPEMDGYEATRAIRSWEKAKEDGHPTSQRHIPIIALTAHAMKGDRDRCLKAGMDDYLTKPMDPELLARRLRDWILGKAPDVKDCSEGPDMEQSPVQSEAVINQESLLRRCMGKQGLADRLVSKFIEQAKRDLTELEVGAQENDAPKVTAMAHRMKGAAANISAESIRQAAAQIEAFGQEQKLENVQAFILELKTHLEQLTGQCTNNK